MLTSVLTVTLMLASVGQAEQGVELHGIGIMGFWAGGHLASTAGTHFDDGRTEAEDAIDRQSCRPDFLILGYPVITFEPPTAHMGSRHNLIGKNADDKLVDYYCS